MVVDLFLVFNFIKRLVTPFKKWDAYKEGVIDVNGNILLRRKDFTTKAQSNSFGVFDQLILNLKKLLAKLPGGQTKLASYAAALWLIKEQKTVEENQMLSEGNDEYLAEQFLEAAEARFMLEYADIEEAAAEEENTVGSGAIAGLGVGAQGEPGVSKKAQKKHKTRVLKRKKLADFGKV
jgi:hypothetical protein|tara:strand:+ start:1736 stop:2272 length:537 start_codon:yes stop_codon:yes gene_type:complete